MQFNSIECSSSEHNNNKNKKKGCDCIKLFIIKRTKQNCNYSEGTHTGTLKWWKRERENEHQVNLITKIKVPFERNKQNKQNKQDKKDSLLTFIECDGRDAGWYHH